RGKIQCLAQIIRQRRERPVIRQPLEYLANIRHPERSLEPFPHFPDPLRQAHPSSAPSTPHIISTFSLHAVVRPDLGSSLLAFSRCFLCSGGFTPPSRAAI